MNHIELFAGCGGLTLGLEKIGFKLILANELSPMAAESFAYNILGEDLSEYAETGSECSKTFWLSSKHKKLKPRLRENPFEYPDLVNTYSDIPENLNELDGSLLIGNITHLNQLLKSNKKLKSELKKGFGKGEIDLVSGGPPCQSFSLAGLREKNNDKNTLPWEFAKFVEHIEPKFVMLENVSGILRAFTENGVSYHAWFEVAKAFARKNYVPLCLHINAKLVGVPQNRPRFIMLGVRADIFESLELSFGKSEHVLFKKSKELFSNIKKKKTVKIDDYKYFDIQRKSDLDVMSDTFLAPLVSGNTVSVKEAIGDLRVSKKTRPSKYVKDLNETFSEVLNKQKLIQNHELRRNNDLVRRRFRLYQILQMVERNSAREVALLWKGDQTTISDDSWNELSSYKYLGLDNHEISFNSKKTLVEYLLNHTTKKRSQKALIANQPAPAALSIPDDTCHYDEGELRTLTVREMARIQSFPDNFVFKSKVTTGGKMRRFEVPQYTQVGNAVPPLLGCSLGLSIQALLEMEKS